MSGNSHVEALRLTDLIAKGREMAAAMHRYCGLAHLQAVLDEYVYLQIGNINGDEAKSAAEKLVDQIGVVFSMHAGSPRVNNRVNNKLQTDATTTGSAHFALAFGDDSQVESESVGDFESRKSDVRTAFNSPFWPFVLATTSVGQERLRQLGELTDGKPIETMLPAGTMLEGSVTILIDGAAQLQKVTGEIIKSEADFASILVSLEDGTEVCYDYHIDGRDHLLLRYFATRKSPPPGQQSFLPSRGEFIGNGDISEDGETLTLSTDYIVYGKTHWVRFQLKRN